MDSKNKYQCSNKSSLQWIKRIQYFIIFVFCLGFLIYQIYECIGKYLEKAVGTADEYVLNNKTKFPELSICPSLPYREEILLKNGILGMYLTFFSKYI